MNNVVLKSVSQISPDSGTPLSVQIVSSTNVESIIIPTDEPPVEPPVETPQESTEQTTVDGNFQSRLEVNYQAHDVALETAKANGHEKTNGLKLEQHHKMDIDDGYEHPDKTKSMCSALNKLFLVMAIVCFALFVCSIAYIVANHEGSVNPHSKHHFEKHIITTDDSSNDQEFYLPSRDADGMRIVVSRRGASIKDILIPYTDSNGTNRHRSIVLKGENFGAVRFGFDEEISSVNMNNQLPSTYQFLNYHNDEWTFERDLKESYIRFINKKVEIIYEFSPETNELMMKTIVSPELDEQIIADPTNNIYFNLRNHGNLSTHHLNISLSTPIKIENGEQIQKNSFILGQYFDGSEETKNYFYKLDRVGIGKNYIGTLREDETKAKINIFSDHVGIIIDPSGSMSSNENITIPDIQGIRISPRQSPVYLPMSIYGPTLIAYPSQAMHTTWWQFEY